MAVSKYAMDWRRVSRWSLAASLVLFVWLMWPTARCTWAGFKEADLPEVKHQQALDADEDVKTDESGFFAGLYQSGKGCYAENSMAAQETWKRNVLWSLLIVGVGAGVAHRLGSRSRGDSGY